MRRWVVYLWFAALLAEAKAQGATEFGRARQEVVRSLSVVKLSDLDFGKAGAPSPALVIDPSSANPGKASFLVHGQPQTIYHVKLPDTISLQLTQSNNLGSGAITVRSFRTFPLDGDTILDSQGRQILAVGATREALPETLAPGKYEATFTITICYNC